MSRTSARRPVHDATEAWRLAQVDLATAERRYLTAELMLLSSPCREHAETVEQQAGVVAEARGRELAARSAFALLVRDRMDKSTAPSRVRDLPK